MVKRLEFFSCSYDFPFMRRLFKLLIFLAVPMAAFLTFLVQPVVGKLLMPRYGGSAGTWMTASLFFQGALLAGYGLAFWLLRQPRQKARAIILAVAIAGPLLAKLPPWDLASLPEWPAILCGLALSLLPALLLTTALGIVLQDWIRATGGKVPYYLYGLSNLGSALALIAYPFKIEPNLGLSTQIAILRGILWLLGVIVVGLVWIQRQLPEPVEEPSASSAESVPISHLALWLALAFGTCTMMLGAIRILTVELGSNPVSWLVPLGIYLLSFTVTFSGGWRTSLTQLSLVLLSAVFFGYLATKGVSDKILSLWPRTHLVLIVGVGCLAGHGLLYQLRPTRRFPFYYLMIAAAGLAAGLFASVGAPNLFDRNYEFVGGTLLILLLVALKTIAHENLVARISLLLILILPPAWFVYSDLNAERQQPARITRLRNYYGTIILAETDEAISASNETTLHGLQLRDEKFRRLPTTYFARGTGVGIVLSGLQRSKSALKVGVIGLGVGTLATYVRQADRLTFWEINPLALKTAREQFTFLQDCIGHVDVEMMDGRIGVRRVRDRFDLLVVDAFNGDSVPIHLITAEAIKEYTDKLGDGLLLVHISNRYVDLFPVLAADALRVGWKAIALSEAPGRALQQYQHASASRYAILYPPAREQEVTGWINEAMKRTDYEYHLTDAKDSARVDWTDNLSSIEDVLSPTEPQPK